MRQIAENKRNNDFINIIFSPSKNLCNVLVISFLLIIIIQHNTNRCFNMSNDIIIRKHMTWIFP